MMRRLRSLLREQSVLTHSITEQIIYFPFYALSLYICIITIRFWYRVFHKRLTIALFILFVSYLYNSFRIFYYLVYSVSLFPIESNSSRFVYQHSLCVWIIQNLWYRHICRVVVIPVCQVFASFCLFLLSIRIHSRLFEIHHLGESICIQRISTSYSRQQQQRRQSRRLSQWLWRAPPRRAMICFSRTNTLKKSAPHPRPSAHDPIPRAAADASPTIPTPTRTGTGSQCSYAAGCRSPARWAPLRGE